MEIGIVGLPLSGKTTLFNLLTHAGAETGVGGRKRANLGISRVPDERLDRLSAIWSPKKTTYATVRYVDVAGVEKSGVKEGFPPEVLASLKNTDALLVVLRGFENEQVPHPDGSVEPVRDLSTLEAEFLLSDLIIVEGRLERLAKQMKGKPEKGLAFEREVLERCRASLESEKPLRELDFSPDEVRVLKGFQFLTQKALVLVLNLGEGDLSAADERLRPFAARAAEQVAATYLCATIEQEISELSPEDARAFMEDLGIESSAMDRIIRTCYELLGLISFFTMGEDECRAWTIRCNTKAPQAAGAIHTDLEKGFIRAEVVTYEDFVRSGSLHACRDKGLLRLEGKEYVVQDGDILNIRFNV